MTATTKTLTVSCQRIMLLCKVRGIPNASVSFFDFFFCLLHGWAGSSANFGSSKSLRRQCLSSSEFHDICGSVVRQSHGQCVWFT